MRLCSHSSRQNSDYLQATLVRWVRRDRFGKPICACCRKARPVFTHRGFPFSFWDSWSYCPVWRADGLNLTLHGKRGAASDLACLSMSGVRVWEPDRLFLHFVSLLSTATFSLGCSPHMQTHLDVNGTEACRRQKGRGGDAPESGQNHLVHSGGLLRVLEGELEGVPMDVRSSGMSDCSFCTYR